MVVKIRTQLLTGSIKNISVYGAGNLPPAPYVIIKQKPDRLGRGIVYKIYVHMMPDHQLDLENYARNELMTLLDKFTATTRFGNYKELKMLKSETELLAVENDDKTISMARGFLSPSPVIF